MLFRHSLAVSSKRFTLEVLPSMSQVEMVSGLIQVKGRPCPVRDLILNKSARALDLLSKALVGVIAFWGHKMGLKTPQSCYSRCLNSLAKITAGTADVTPGIWNEHYKIGKAEKALVNIIKNSLQAIKLQQYLWRGCFFFSFSFFLFFHLYFYLANERVMSHILVTQKEYLGKALVNLKTVFTN